MKYCLLIFVTYVFLNVHGQTLPGCWMWSGGVKYVHSYVGNFGTKGVASSSNTPPGLWAASEWQDQQGNFWLYGGLNNASGFQDNMWKYNLFTKEWTWVSGSGVGSQNPNPKYGTLGVPSVTNSPGIRVTSYSWVDITGKLWLYGGIGSATAQPGSGVAYGDLWKYDPNNNTWAWMKGQQYNANFAHYGVKGIEDSLNNPPVEQDMGVSWTDDVNGNLWLVVRNGCLWRYNITTNNWTWMKGDTSQVYPNSVYGTKGLPAMANTPGATRYDYARWKDSKGDFWYLYSSGYFLKVLWRYQIQNNCWTWMWGDTTFNSLTHYENKCDTTVNLLKPAGRNAAKACWVDGCDNLWLFGGTAANQQFSTFTLNDLVFYSTRTNKWTWVAGDTVQKLNSSFGVLNVASPTNYPCSRTGSHPFKTLDGDLGFFGGIASNGINCLADTWIFTPDTTCSDCNIKLLPLSTNTSLDKNLNHPYLFPNPTNGNFEIRNGSDFTQIEIYKITGELIFRKQISSPSIDFEIEHSGMYAVHLISKHYKRTLKLIVTK